MKKYIDKNELDTRIELNFSHLENDSYYSIEEIFSPYEYQWYGDKEGRALLAFMSHCKISGRKIPCMEKMLSLMPKRVNAGGYFGPLYNGIIHEEQLSGHSWLLRGLAEHYEAFSDSFCLEEIKKITENLYLPLRGKINTYPVNRSKENSGGVSGEMTENEGGWLLSSDIGCAFMSIDGLSHVYSITSDVRIKELLDEMTEFYLSIDKISLKAQTHCTLTSARGMLRMYNKTGEVKYLDGAKMIFDLYINHGGMTKTWQNLNWWGREDSWTEPCAIVDSLMVSCELYKITGDENFRAAASRIYHNGLSTSQRDNGGAGTDTLICEGSPHDSLRPLMYEAFFCCSMRLAEGLWYINENKDLLYAEVTGRLTKDSDGIFRDNDLIYCLPDEALLPYAEKGISADNKYLYPIVKLYKVPKDILMNSAQKIVF